MSDASAPTPGSRENLLALLASIGWTPDKLILLKNVLGISPPIEEVTTFLWRCHQWGLDPLDKEQVTLQKRRNNQEQRDVYTTVVGVAGRRIIASRTRNYAPGGASRYEYDENGSLVRAYSSVRIYHPESKTWLDVEEEARYDEFVQTYQGVPSGLWKTKPHVMLAKVAEVRALRRAFPESFSGIYDTHEFDKEEGSVVGAALPSAQSTSQRAMQQARKVVGLPAAAQPIEAPIEEPVSDAEIAAQDDPFEE